MIKTETARWDRIMAAAVGVLSEELIEAGVGAYQSGLFDPDSTLDFVALQSSFERAVAGDLQQSLHDRLGSAAWHNRCMMLELCRERGRWSDDLESDIAGRCATRGIQIGTGQLKDITAMIRRLVAVAGDSPLFLEVTDPATGAVVDVVRHPEAYAIGERLHAVGGARLLFIAARAMFALSRPTIDAMRVTGTLWAGLDGWTDVWWRRNV